MMHYIADGQLVNDNGISTLAIAFFTALFGAIATVIIQLIQVKAKANEAKDVALETKIEAAQARQNTDNISNGFAGNMDRQLKRLIQQNDNLASAFQNHLEWHVDHPTQKR